MPSYFKDNWCFLIVELEDHVYRHFGNQLMLWQSVWATATRIVSRSGCVNLTFFLSVNNSIRSYNTRHASFFQIPLFRTNIRQFSISFRSPNNSNNLAMKLKKHPKPNVL